MTRLWRDEPVLAPVSNAGAPSPVKHVFPSGRQALSYSLRTAGLARNDRVAIPEWSPHCVISAVGKVATPVPMHEVLKHSIKVDAVLIYEQWGWPFIKDGISELADRFGGSILIHDTVDSAHFNIDRCVCGEDRRSCLHNADCQAFKTVYRIVSLSKILGLDGGGLALRDGQYLEFVSDVESVKILPALYGTGFDGAQNKALMSAFRKFEIVALPTALKVWLSTNDLLGAIEYEHQQRQQNLLKILDAACIQDWPSWMKKAVNNGAAPGIIPLLRDKPDDILLKNQQNLINSLGVETSIYNFNWSGDPLQVKYEKCLAVPVHGLVKNIYKILDSLKY